jgi:hypothetical protein
MFVPASMGTRYCAARSGRCQVATASGVRRLAALGPPRRPAPRGRGRVEEVALAIDLPFGLKPGGSFQLQVFPLDAGDRIIS